MWGGRGGAAGGGFPTREAGEPAAWGSPVPGKAQEACCKPAAALPWLGAGIALLPGCLPSPQCLWLASGVLLTLIMHSNKVPRASSNSFRITYCLYCVLPRILVKPCYFQPCKWLFPIFSGDGPWFSLSLTTPHPGYLFLTTLFGPSMVCHLLFLISWGKMSHLPLADTIRWHIPTYLFFLSFFIATFSGHFCIHTFL